MEPKPKAPLFADVQQHAVRIGEHMLSERATL